MSKLKEITKIDSLISKAKKGKILVNEISNALESKQGWAYLFDCLQNDPNFDYQWIYLLDKLAVFSIENTPKVKKNSEGNLIYTNWLAGLILKSVAERNLLNPDKKITKILIKTINTYINEHNKIEFTQNSLPLVCEIILHLPLSKITPKYIKFIKSIGLTSPHSFLGSEITTKYLKRIIEEKNEKRLIELIDICFTESPQNKVNVDLRPLIEEYLIDDFIKDYHQSVSAILGNRIVEILKKRIKTLSQKHPLQFSKLVIISIAEDEQNWNTNNLSYSIVRYLRNILEFNYPVDKTYEIVEKLLTEKEAILNRIGFYLIDKKYRELSPLFWKKNRLNDSESKLEVYNIVKNNHTTFTQNQISKYLAWIGKLELSSSLIYIDDTRKYQSYRKLEWLMPLKDRPDSEIKNLIVKHHKIAGQTPSHPGYDIHHTTTWGGNYGKIRITDQPIIEAIDRINNKAKWDGYDSFAIQEDIRKLTIDRSNEVISNLNDFLALDLNQQYFLIDGFRQLAEQKETEIEWIKILNYLLELLNTIENSHSTEKQVNTSNIFGIICWLIREGANKDKNIFSKTELLKCIDILIIIDQKDKQKFEYINKDPIFDVINSTRGKLYEAFIIVSLRLAPEAGISKWNEQIKDIFTKRLTDNSNFDEFYWTVGFYIPQIGYLDKDWLEIFKEKIFINTERIQNYAFRGYLCRTNRVYKDIYYLLTEKYSNFIEVNENSERLSSKMLVQHIIIAYSQKWEYSHKLLEKVFTSKNVTLWEYLIEFIQFEYSALQPEQIDYLWIELLTNCSKIEEKKAHEIIFRCASLIKFVRVLDEEIKIRLIQSIKHSQKSPINTDILKGLQRLSKEYPLLAGEIMLEIVRANKVDFYYNRTIINEMIDMLFELSQSKIANEICEAMVENYQFYIKNIYFKYNPPLS